MTVNHDAELDYYRSLENILGNYIKSQFQNSPICFRLFANLPPQGNKEGIQVYTLKKVNEISPEKKARTYSQSHTVSSFPPNYNTTASASGNNEA